MLISDRLDALLCFVIGLIMAGASHSVSLIPDQEIYAWLTAFSSATAFFMAIQLAIRSFRRRTSGRA